MIRNGDERFPPLTVVSAPDRQGLPLPGFLRHCAAERHTIGRPWWPKNAVMMESFTYAMKCNSVLRKLRDGDRTILAIPAKSSLLTQITEETTSSGAVDRQAREMVTPAPGSAGHRQ